MDDLPKRARWVYNDGGAVDYTMAVPQAAWIPVERGLGGSDVSGAGVPESYEVRRDYMLELSLRFLESELASVMRLVRHLQRSGTATFYPDVDVGGTSHTVYGELPAMGEDVRPTRNSSDPGMMELTIVVRRTTAAAVTDSYY